MSELLKNNKDKKEAIKDILMKLHEGMSAEDAKNQLVNRVGNITATEIAEAEQALINEGMPIDDIKKFCNVHALLFEDSLSEIVLKEESPGHPLNTFKLENRKIEELTAQVKKLIKNKSMTDSKKVCEDLNNFLIKLKDVEYHYVRKEQLLFPFLEKYGFMGPSKVMWGKHNEIRDLRKNAISNIENGLCAKDSDSYIRQNIEPLVEEVEGMIFKEENILFPASSERLNPADWIEILKESDDIGYTFINRPEETSAVLEDLKRNIAVEPEIINENEIKLPTGVLNLKELMYMLNSLPVDLTFIDKDDTVRYFSDNKDRIFVRTKSVIGRKVQNCHPPQSVHAVEEIIDAFKKGKRSEADFWLNLNDKFVFIKFIAIRDSNFNYLGTVEMTMNIAGLKSLEGEKRLLSPENKK